MKNVRWWARIQSATVVVLALVSTMATAQETGASLNGIVHDTTGAIVNNATVVAINAATNAQVTAQTQSGGEYTLLNLPPGTYTLTVTPTATASGSNEKLHGEQNHADAESELACKEKPRSESCAAQPYSFRNLLRIADAINTVAAVVADQQRAVRRHGHAHRAPIHI